MSLAVPGSVIENTQTMELATAVAGLLARTAAVFCVDEVVVVDDAPGVRRATTVPSARQKKGARQEVCQKHSVHCQQESSFMLRQCSISV